MSLPTLKDLGLEDKRKRIPDEVKAEIKKELDNGETNMSYLSRKYNVSICSVRMIRNYEHERAIMKKSRDSRGGYKAYYDKDKQARSMQKVSDRKKEKIKELMEFYKAHKGENK